MIQQNLLHWYAQNKRNLPWRSTKDPYLIWLSEVILQQTRVAQGLPYYLRFVENFPTVKHLAAASLDQVLKLWQGLGYYSRGRNLHATALMVMDSFDGQFPSSYKELITLKGIGDYTAAAIASFSSNEAVAVLDGNVYRVLSRFFANQTPINTTQGKKVFSELATSFLNKKQAAEHNQAIMELGALVCKPTQPDCPNCPLQAKCQAFQTGKQTTFPAKIPKKKPQDVYFYYFLINRNGRIAVFQRPEKGIWHGLFDLPLIESTRELEAQELQKECLSNLGLNMNLKSFKKPDYECKHLLTHKTIKAVFYELLEVSENVIYPEPLQWLSLTKIKSLPVSRLFHKYQEAKHLH